MPQQKIALFIILGLVLLSAGFYGGVLYDKKNAVTTPKLPLVGNDYLVKDYTFYLRGEILDIGENYLVVGSANKSERWKVRTVSGTIYSEQPAMSSQESFMAQERGLFETVSQEEISKGEMVNIIVKPGEGYLTAIKISKVLSATE